MEQPHPFIDEPLFILGLPRSGTSLVAGALGHCGAFLGKTVPGGGPENPVGFFENIYLREQIIKKILGQMGADILGVKVLPTLSRLPRVSGLKETIAGLLAHEGYEFEQPWLFKDAKLTLLWPVFLQAFPQAKWIIVRRDNEDIVRSCLNTPFMRQHSDDPAFWQRWTQEYLVRLARLKKSTNLVQEIWPAGLMSGSYESLESLVSWAGLNWQPEKIEKHINPAYWHAA